MPRPKMPVNHSARNAERKTIKADLELTGNAINIQMDALKTLKGNIKRWTESAKAMERTLAISQIYYKNLSKKFDAL